MPSSPENPESSRTIDEETALALAGYFDEGFDGHIPTYAEEQLIYLEQKAAEDTGRKETESE